MVMEVARREHCREDRRVGVELDLHQAVNDRGRDELMAINAAIHDPATGNDGVIPGRLRQSPRVQGNLEGSWHLEVIQISGWIGS